jgi:hypothetical protein
VRQAGGLNSRTRVINDGQQETFLSAAGSLQILGDPQALRRIREADSTKSFQR